MTSMNVWAPSKYTLFIFVLFPTLSPMVFLESKDVSDSQLLLFTCRWKKFLCLYQWLDKFLCISQVLPAKSWSRLIYRYLIIYVLPTLPTMGQYAKISIAPGHIRLTVLGFEWNYLFQLILTLGFPFWPCRLCRLQYLDLSMAIIEPTGLWELLSACRFLRKLSLENCTIDDNVCRLARLKASIINFWQYMIANKDLVNGFYYLYN